MLYTHENTNFKENVHPSLQRRMRIFIIMGVIMLGLVGWDLYQGTLTLPITLVSMLLGGIVGFVSTRIFHLSWDKDGLKVVSRIDSIGWVVLVLYIAFEISRTFFVMEFLHPAAATSTAITFAFISTALLARVIGLRGRIVKILEDEKVFG